MSSSFAPGLILEQQTTTTQSSRQVLRRMWAALSATVPGLRHKLAALGGLALFGCALTVAFRIIALDASQQLQQPGIDFAICGAVGILGLAISWVHLGETGEQHAPSTAEPRRPAVAFAADAIPAAAPAFFAVPAGAKADAFAGSASPSRPRKHGRFCPFCGEKMVAPGAARSGRICPVCRHLEDHGHVSFLDGDQTCECQHCRQHSVVSA